VKTDKDIRRAEVHEVGHSLAAYLASGACAPIEIDWRRPGDGNCYTKYPRDWPDDARFWLYSAVVDAGGHAAEQVLLYNADPRHCETDMKNLQLACQQLIEEPEFTGVAVPDLQAQIQGVTAHLLGEHHDTLAFLAGRASQKQRWGGSDLTQAVLTADFQRYRAYEPLLEGDWRGNWTKAMRGYTTARIAALEYKLNTWDRRST
jgi:hypothetical protein